MGWLYFEKPENVKSYMDNLFSGTGKEKSYRVIKSAIVNVREYYAAVDVLDSFGRRVYTFAAVCMLDYRPKDYPYTFGYKDMDEAMGPTIDNCPAGILDLLTEPQNEYAESWRNRCREKIAKRKAAGRFNVGDIVMLKNPAVFGAYGPVSLFEVKSKKPWRFIAREGRLNGRTVQLRKYTREQLVKA